MIVHLKGTLQSATPLSAVVDIQGIGYEVHIPVTTAEKLPAIGESVFLHTVAVYREDTQALYGFSGTEECDFFRLLVEKVSGIGPKIALNILSRMSVTTLREAIASGDVVLLSKCQGIGKKTAERLVVELRDKVFPAGLPEAAASGSSLSPPVTGVSSARQDALAGLMTLGYKAAEADKALRKAEEELGPDATTEALIKFALA
ncbi:MAG: Holliday junction branch migration protein RuvA [Verrucomicrobiota bacterium]